jgi:phosphoglucomutase
MTDPRAGKLPPDSMLIDPGALVHAFSADKPDPSRAAERVAFGTSGHRGSALRRSFNEDHIVAITHAICDYRAEQGITGPLFLGRDTHALSLPASRVACECLAARGVAVRVAAGDAFTPTPAVSHAVIAANRAAIGASLADGIVVTPSHNPPEDGGFKYDPPHGGPAETPVTSRIERRSNDLLREGVTKLPRVSYERAIREGRLQEFDFITPYVRDLPSVVDLTSIAHSKVRLGVDPMGGASVEYWQRIAEMHGVNLEVVQPAVDATFRFIPVDHDGKIRTDCSSPYAMSSLVAMRERYDLCFANDADADRHGVVSRSGGLLPPNHYLAVCVQYLFGTRTWSERVAIGKTVVSSAMLDRVARSLGRQLVEVPVGFKWFVAGLGKGTLGFAGEESAGASFLRLDGSVWTTDKDGIVADLLAAEILAHTGRDPAQQYEALERQHGASCYVRVDQPADAQLRARIQRLAAEEVELPRLAGAPVTGKTTTAPGNGERIGGIKVESASGWFAVRPSGTEDIVKIYAESFIDEDHLNAIVGDARALVERLSGG